MSLYDRIFEGRDDWVPENIKQFYARRAELGMSPAERRAEYEKSAAGELSGIERNVRDARMTRHNISKRPEQRAFLQRKKENPGPWPSSRKWPPSERGEELSDASKRPDKWRRLKRKRGF